MNKMSPLVRSVLERFSEGNITKAELTRYAASIGLRTRYGKKLSAESINRLLKHPVYASYVADNLTDWQLYDAKHPAIINRHTYELNQMLLYGPKSKKGEPRLRSNPAYPLKSLLKCSNCSKTLYASAPTTGAGSKSPRYHCSRTSCKGKVKSVKASYIHEKFEILLRSMQPGPTFLKLYKEILIVESSKQLGNINRRLSQIRNKLDEIDDRILLVLKKFTNDEISESEKSVLLNDYRKDRSVLENELEQFQSVQEVKESQIEIAMRLMENTAGTWLDANIDNKIRFQNLFVSRRACI